MIIEIHEVEDILQEVNENKSAFCRLVGVHNQNMDRYLLGYVVIEREGKFKLDKEEFWR